MTGRTRAPAKAQPGLILSRIQKAGGEKNGENPQEKKPVLSGRLTEATD